MIKKSGFRWQIIFLVTFFLIGNNGYGQLIKEYKKYGDMAFKMGDFKNAMRHYHQAYLRDSLNTYLLYRKAESARMFQSYAVAYESYNSVIKKDAFEQYLDSYYWMGEISKVLEDYEGAFSYFRSYLDKSVSKNDYLYWKAKRELENEMEIRDLVKNKDSLLKVIHYDIGVNSEYSELAPSFYGDSMYLTTLRLELDETVLEKGLSSQRFHVLGFQAIGDYWSSSSPIKMDLTRRLKQKHIGNYQKIDDTSFLFTACSDLTTSSLVCDVYIKSGKNKARKFPGLNVVGSTTTQPHYVKLNEQEADIYFVSNRSGSNGMDIYKARVRNGIAIKIESIDSINTIGDELSPHFNQKSNTIFFSSDWHPGLGGMDVFSAKMKEDSSFYGITNLGKPYNSSLNDIDYVPNLENTKAFLASNRSESFFVNEEYCCHDIYMLKKVTREELLKEEEGVSYVEDYSALEANYEDSVKLQNEQKKSLNFSEVYYELTNSFIDLRYPTIYFDFNRFDLNEIAISTLDSTISVMRSNSVLEIELAAHTDGIGSDAYNLRLSKKRAKFVKSYLIENGFDPEKISFTFFGEKEPIVPNTFEDGSDNPGGRRLNRRVELRYTIE